MTRRVFRQAGVGKFLLLWGLSLLFGLSARTGGPSTLTLHMLAVLSDQYYAVFAVLPVFLFLCGGVMEDDAEPVLLRYGGYARYFFAKWRTLAAAALPLWLGQLAALALSGWGKPLIPGWPGAEEGGLWRDVFDLLKTVFPRPETALLCAALHLLAGYWLIALLTLWLGHFLPRARAIQTLAALYILTVFQTKLPVMSRPPLVYLTGLSHWTLLLHNLTAPWRCPLTAIVAALTVAVILFTVRQYWQKRFRLSRRAPKGLSPLCRRMLFNRRNLLLAGALPVLLAAWTWVQGGPPESGRMWTIRLLAGHGTGKFWPLGLLTLLLAEVLPLWPLGELVSRTVSGRSIPLTVRLRRRTDLLWGILKTAALWLLLWGVLLLAAETLPVLLFDLQVDFALAVWAAALRLSDMALQFLLLFAVLCLTGYTASGFVALVLSHFLAVLSLPWLPVGLSSLLRLTLPETGGTVPPRGAAAVLIGCCILLLLWLRLWGMKRLFERTGG